MNEITNWTDFLNTDSDAIIFGYTDIVLSNLDGPLQLYFCFVLFRFENSTEVKYYLF